MCGSIVNVCGCVVIDLNVCGHVVIVNACGHGCEQLLVGTPHTCTHNLRFPAGVVEEEGGGRGLKWAVAPTP